METTETTTILLRVSRRHRTYVALIEGTSERYGLDREFIEIRDLADIRWSRSGDTGYADLTLNDLDDGIYEIRCDRQLNWYHVEAGTVREISKSDATALAEAL